MIVDMPNTSSQAFDIEVNNDETEEDQYFKDQIAQRYNKGIEIVADKDCNKEKLNRELELNYESSSLKGCVQRRLANEKLGGDHFSLN